MPKEMLTIVDKPLIQYVYDEAREAGIEHFIFVTGRNKGVIEDHFDRMFELDTTLAARGNKKRRAGDAGPQPAGRRRHQLYSVSRRCSASVTRSGARATSSATKPFAVVLPDELVLNNWAASSQMIDAASALGEKSNLLAVEGVPDHLTHQYGIWWRRQASPASNILEVDYMVEKPPKGTAPSNPSITGRYILQPEIFKILEAQERGAGSEIQLTDATRSSLPRRQKFYGVEFEGERQ